MGAGDSRCARRGHGALQGRPFVRGLNSEERKKNAATAAFWDLRTKRSEDSAPQVQMPSIFSALASASSDSWCLPALWSVSPSARNFFTSDNCFELNFGCFAIAASIFLISAGQ